MKPAPRHPLEDARLAALDTLEILDTVPEVGFDDLTRLASTICGTPIALVSLVDHYRQWFKSRVGLEMPETPREFAFCSHAILGEQLFVVPDAHRDERFQHTVAEHLHRTVSNLQDTSSEEVSLSFKPTQLDAHLLLSEVTRDFQHRLVSSPRRFTQSVKLVEPLITADRELLRRTLTNLLDNAFQYTAVGSSRVTLEASNPEPGLLELRVRDEGPAIAPAARAHLFDTHAPAEAPTSGRAEGGNRLALAFCRRAVQAHGGWLWVEDNHPKGVAFCIRLPVRPHGPLFSAR